MMRQPSQAQVDVELFIEYVFGALFLLTRLGGRVFVLGRRGLHLDDVFTAVALGFWSLDLALRHSIGVTGSSAGQTYATSLQLDEAAVRSFRAGDRMEFASWCSYLCVVWAMKGIVLAWYKQLELNVWQEKMTKWVGGYAGVTFLTCFLFQFLNCVPIQDAWRVKPYAGDKCTFRPANYVLFSCLSITTDLGIMAIPLPLLWQVKATRGRKALFGTLSITSGTAVIIMTLLRTIYSLTSPRNVPGPSPPWSSREYLVTSLVVSAPALALLWGLHRIEPKHPSTDVVDVAPNPDPPLTNASSSLAHRFFSRHLFRGKRAVRASLNLAKRASKGARADGHLVSVGTGTTGSDEAQLLEAGTRTGTGAGGKLGHRIPLWPGSSGSGTKRGSMMRLPSFALDHMGEDVFGELRAPEGWKIRVTDEVSVSSFRRPVA